MIITIKNLQQQTFTIDFDADKTVLELKHKIQNERGTEYLIEKQKLIYAGVILDDDRTIASYKVDDKKFIVVMLTRDVGGNASTSATMQRLKQKSAEPEENADESPALINENPRQEVSKTERTESTENKNKSATEIIQEGGANAAVTTTATPTSVVEQQTAYTSADLVGELANATLQTRAESNLLMGEEYNRTVTSMVEMGYPRAQVERAMAASFNNPERAVEYLINGIPEDDDGFNAATATEGAVDTGAEVVGGTARVSTEVSATPNEAEIADPFEFLRSQPQFLQMRSLVYQNPDLLQAVLQQIGQTNPALLQLISENQDAFLNMLNQPLENETGSTESRPPGSNRRTEAATGNLTAVETTLPELPTPRLTAGSATAARTITTQQSAEREARVESARDGSGAQSGNIATIRLTSQDLEAIERLKALGFPEPLVLQAYFACEKDEQMAANFLISSAFDD